MSSGLEEAIFSGAILRVHFEGQLIYEKAYGRLGGPETEEVDPNTLFDLASLTKVLATTPAWILLASNEPEILDRSISRWFPDIDEEVKKITPRRLLAHSSGLAAWRPHYLSWWQDKPTLGSVVDTILCEPLEYPPGEGCIYSDLGFMVLARIIELETGKPLNEFCRERIYAPLGIDRDIMFNPAGEERRIAWTRNGESPGLVNDLNARALGGLSGHAGLFGTAQAVASIATEILAGLKGRKSFFNPAIVQVFGHRAGLVQGASRALGFDTPSADGSSSGRFFSASSLGHTGFTGTSIWIFPEKELVVILLTNRVIMGESDLRIRSFRPLLHDAIVEEIVLGK